MFLIFQNTPYTEYERCMYGKFPNKLSKQVRKRLLTLLPDYIIQQCLDADSNGTLREFLETHKLPFDKRV